MNTDYSPFDCTAISFSLSEEDYNVRVSYHGGWNEAGREGEDARHSIDLRTSTATFMCAEDLRELADRLEKMDEYNRTRNT